MLFLSLPFHKSSFLSFFFFSSLNYVLTDHKIICGYRGKVSKEGTILHNTKIPKHLNVCETCCILLISSAAKVPHDLPLTYDVESCRSFL